MKAARFVRWWARRAWRRRRHGPQQLEPATFWRFRVDVRVAEAQWRRLGTAGLRELVGLEVDPRPPAAGPEVELSILIDAVDEQRARRMGRRLWERVGYDVLAVRVGAARVPPIAERGAA